MIPSISLDSIVLTCTLCTLPAVATTRKTRAGVSFDPEIAEALDKHSRLLRELAVNRSEIVNAILAQHFEGNRSSEAVWEIVRKRRRVKRRS